MTTSMDMSEVMALAHDFGHASRTALKSLDKIVEKGAMNIKRDMVAYAQYRVGGGHAQFFPASISYDSAYRVGSVRYEIGPDKDRRQGALGNLLYFGSANNAPVLDIDVGMNDEAPRLTTQIGILAARLALGNG